MMTKRSTVWLVFLGGAALFAAGCEDSAAKQRSEVGAALASASADLQRATFGSPTPRDDHFESIQNELNSLINRLGRIGDGAPGQQAAKAILTAEAHRGLAVMEFRLAHEIELELLKDRDLILSQLDGIMRLTARSDAQAEVSTEAQRQALQQMRQEMTRSLEQLRQELAQLQPPITDRVDRNRADEERVTSLRDQADDLFRRATELGHADGFHTFEQAIQLQREADQLEYRIAQRELELLLQYRPQSEWIETSISHLEESLESAAATRRDLEAFEQSFLASARRGHDGVAEGRQELQQSYHRLMQRINDELAPLYENVENNFDRAANYARQAAGRLRGGEASAARLLEARCQEALGGARWTWARGIGDHLVFLNTLIANADALENVDIYRNDFNRLSAQREELIGHARASYQAASDAIQAVTTGREAQVAQQYRNAIELVLATLDGEDVDPSRFAPPPMPGDSFGDPPGESVSSQGFGSPDELVRFLQQLDEGRAADLERFAAALHAESRIGVTMKNLVVRVSSAMSELEQAAIEQFGEADLRALAESAGDAAGFGFDELRLVDQTADRAIVRYRAMPGMPEETMELVNIDGEWFVNADSMVETEGEPGMEGMEDFMLQMMDQMGQAMAQAIRELAQRVRQGEFDTIRDLERAIEETMQAPPGGMPNGFPG